ncbi:MAG: hypothetical protein LBR35_00980, partial [Rickettsiales bacterium]|nr:hypothetical protein [Rickettsiales bacterium]
AQYKTKTNAYKGSIYAGYSRAKWFGLANLDYSYATLDTDSIFNSTSENANIFTAHALAGRMITYKTFAASIYGKYDFTNVDLEIETSNENRASLGLALNYGYQLKGKDKFIPNFYYEIGYDFSGASNVYEMRTDGSVVKFDEEYDMGNLMHKIGLRLTYMTRKGSSVSAGFESNIRDNYKSNEIRLNGTYKF